MTTRTTRDIRTGEKYEIVSEIEEAIDGHYTAEGKGKDGRTYILEWWIPYVGAGYEWEVCDMARLIE